MTADIAAAFQAQAAAGPAALEADAGIGVTLGRLISLLELQRQAEQLAAQDIWVQDLPAAGMTLTAGAGTIDEPNQLGPRDGYAWAVHWVAAAGFTAGTVNLYLGTPDTVANSNLRFAFTQAGVWEPPRTATILLPGARMVFIASGITGSVVISGQITQMTLRTLSRFLV